MPNVIRVRPSTAARTRGTYAVHRVRLRAKEHKRDHGARRVRAMHWIRGCRRKEKGEPVVPFPTGTRGSGGMVAAIGRKLGNGCARPSTRSLPRNSARNAREGKISAQRRYGGLIIFRAVHAELVQALSAQRPQIVARWEAYLRIQPVVSALAHPDTLMFGVDGVLNEVFARLRRRPAKRPVRRWVDSFCSRNPLRAFYASGEQALVETLVVVQTSHGYSRPRERTTALEELRRAIRAVALPDLEGIASLCRTCTANITGTGRCPAEGHRAGWSARPVVRRPQPTRQGGARLKQSRSRTPPRA